MRATTRLALAGALALPAVLAACGKEAPPPPPPPPPKKVAQKVDAQSFVSDPRVQFPQEHAPTDESLAQAVADFASALARGDASAFGAMLDNPSKQVLEQQRSSGAWTRETSGIETVRVVALTAQAESADLALAVQDPRGAYLLGWKAVRTPADSWTFGGAPAPDTRAPRASDLDGAVAAPSPAK